MALRSSGAPLHRVIFDWGNPTMVVPRHLLIVVALAALIGLTSRAGIAADLKTGDMIDKNSWQQAEGLLPPEILQHYKNGEYANNFVEWPMAKTTLPPDFKAGSDANEGKFTTSPEGTIIEKATGKQPPYIIGFP